MMETPSLRKVAVHKDPRGESFRLFEGEDLVDFKVSSFYCLSVRNILPGIIRGMHRTQDSAAGPKLLSVTSGAIFDVTIDLRPESPFFGQGYTCTLSEADHAVLRIPVGFLHGYQTLVEDSSILYGLDEKFSTELDAGYSPFSKCLQGIWPLGNSASISEKDASWPELSLENLVFQNVPLTEPMK
jgi:dTDP-4-dehydrorhamnose 3,5-epimerase